MLHCQGKKQAYCALGCSTIPQLRRISFIGKVKLMRPLYKSALVLLALTYQVMLICAVSLANPAITDSLFVVGPSENPSSTVHIRNQVAVESASFSAGTPRGWIDISLFQTATKACYITNSQYRKPSDIVYAGGTVAINGHQFVVSATDTVQDVIDMINDDSSLGVTAQLSGCFVALYQNNFGSDHLIAYAETDDILNGCNLAVQWGTDAKASSETVYTIGITARLNPIPAVKAFSR
jgi:hypothetical protein